MTCDDCQAIIIDLTRGVDVDRATRDEARRHAALCAHCGALQQEQQWLTTQLRAIAAEESTRHAPARVEIAALAAYRAAYAGGAGSATAPVHARRTWVIPGALLTGLAAAAMALMFVWPSAHTVPQDASARASATVANSAETAGTPSSLESNKQGRGDGVPAAIVAARPSRTRVEAVLARATTRGTEFLPLPYVEPLRATEARHVVRVSMSSGDEMILGMLPADRRSGQPFEADVLVGEDGIARAIRIVH